MTSTTTPYPSLADDARLVAPAFTSPRELTRAPWSGATWRGVSQTVVGFFWLLVVGIVAMVYVATSAGLVPVFLLGLAMLALVPLASRGFARVEGTRLAAQTGAVVPPAPPRRPERPGFWASLSALLRDSRAWGAVLYAAVSVFTTTLAFALVIGLGGAGLAAIASPAYGPGEIVSDWFGQPRVVQWLALLAGGLVVVWLAALVAQAATLLQVRMARGMFGRSRASLELEAADAARAQAEVRAAHVEQTRTQVVDAADDERRRIERDLHDGAQQRLVALGVELGAAKRRAAGDPQAATEALDHAHREIKETLAELRDLVRGIHPAVLTDRGLDAALSALAARTPVPVTVDVADPDALTRCGQAAQAAAYFVAAEALTNVAKHARATSARVSVRCADGRLRLVVADDGRGGASAAPGSGLEGLRSRVAALDGTFDLASPAGAGTTLTVEVPCAS